MKLIKEHIYFILVLCAAAFLRFVPLFDYQFTYDELSALDRVQFSGFSEVMEKGVKIDAHPALIQLLLFYMVKSVGFVNWIIKLPFIVLSLATIIYGYAFCLRNFSRQSAMISAIILSFSLPFVFSATMARP
jgi:hypothetical protein